MRKKTNTDSHTRKHCAASRTGPDLIRHWYNEIRLLSGSL